MIGSVPEPAGGLAQFTHSPQDQLSNDYAGRLKQLLVENRRIIAHLESGKTKFVIRRPRWPIKSILLVVRGSTGDQPAIDIAIQLANKCQASLATLATVPDVPAFYRNCPNIQIGLPMLFELNTQPGRQLRGILEQMVHYGIIGEIQACEATPDQQITQIVVTMDPDLIVISKEPYGRIWRLFFGEIIQPLLRWIDRPVLIA